MNRALESVRAFEQRLNEKTLSADDSDSPIFIFACCWRSGSTLLQRLCMSGRLLWGEPYGQGWLMEHMVSTVRTISLSWPPNEFLATGEPPSDTEEPWIANSYPPLNSFKSAYRAFFDELLRLPAVKHGQGWGAKFVRGSSEHAALLRWLYPNAKLLFLIRNPHDCLRSWNAWKRSGVVAYDRWPDIPLTASRLAAVWQRNTQGFLDDYLHLDARLVRYEDLIEEKLQPLEDYLGFALRREALGRRFTMRPDAGPAAIPVSDAERTEFEKIVEPLASELGYRPTSADRSPSAPPLSKPATRSEVAKPKTVALVPVGTHIEPACELGLRQLEAAGYVVRRVRGFSAIDQARNAIASGALRDGFDQLLWIDSDIAFTIDDVERLRSHELPIVCGIYPKKGRRELASHLMPGSRAVTFGQAGGLLELTYAGAGFLLVDREVFETMQRQLDLPLCNEHFGEPVVPYFQPMVKELEGKRWYLAEDYAFCERARQCDYKIMADTTIRLRHVGTYEYTWEDAGRSPERFATFKLNLGEPKAGG